MGILWALRQEIATLQRSQGIPLEEYGFMDLLSDILVKTYSVGSTIYYFATGLLGQIFDIILPMFCICLLVMRFILDKTLSISMEEDRKKKLKAVSHCLVFN